MDGVGKVFERSQEGVCKVSGKCLKSTWILSERYLKVSGSYLNVVRLVFGWFREGVRRNKFHHLVLRKKTMKNYEN